jgi:hypothetical protein
MMVLGRLLLLAALPLVVSCQSGGSYPDTPPEPRVKVSRREAEKTLKTLTFPMTRAELALHFPAVGVNEDPPLFSFWLSKEPGDYEYCRLGKDLYLQMRVQFKDRPNNRPYPTGFNPVRRSVRTGSIFTRRGNRIGSIPISPDLPTHAIILKGRPDARDVVFSGELKQMSKEDDIEKGLLVAYQYYKDEESQVLTPGS